MELLLDLPRNEKTSVCVCACVCAHECVSLFLPIFINLLYISFYLYLPLSTQCQDHYFMNECSSSLHTHTHTHYYINMK